MIRLFRVFAPAGAVTLLATEVILLTAVFVLASYLALGVDPTVFLLNDSGLARILIVIAIIILGLHLRDRDENIYIPSRVALMQQLCRVIGLAFIAQGLAHYFLPALSLPLAIAVPGLQLALVALFAWRLFFSALAQGLAGRSRLLLAGSSPLLAEIGSLVEERPHMMLAIGGYAADGPVRGTPLPGGVVLGPVASLVEIVRETETRRVVIGVPPEEGPAAAESLLILRASGVSIEEVETAHERLCGRVSLRTLQPALIFTRQFAPAPQILALRGFVNSLAAAVALLALSPVMAFAAALVRFTVGKPVLRKERHAGLDGVPFTLLRFRMPHAGESGAGRMAALFRRFRLDGLPQLFNVLRGEMNFVGPSPARVEFGETLSRLIPAHRQRNSVRPGVTGWRRIKFAGSNAITELEYDLYYIKHASFTLDAVIGFQALKTTLLGR
jgi:lipopolysaccharide/colanic/teichoic acid biosynthesis glycosyltransferase